MPAAGLNKYPIHPTIQLYTNQEAMMRKITMLGSGLIGTFYTMSLHGYRAKDRVSVLYSRTKRTPAV
jgi:hypothetical protein